jgi:uncharacterized repeat protein (TIGR04138 family)
LDEAGGYAPECYGFIRDGLAHTVEKVHGTARGATEQTAPDESRHVSGRQLSEGLRDYAVQRYGLLARSVLARWGITRTLDFGRIIFAMIDVGLMRKQDDDRLEDFEAVYDFADAFGEPERTLESKN